ncbi:MAG: hypothetical protein U5K74_07485 [Gemmatimonadaceae bacterium]|nr:hypothetical protein [Gemmatimonadaceae bacterium]
MTAALILGCLVSIILPHRQRLLAAVLQDDVPRGRALRVGAMGATLPCSATASRGGSPIATTASPTAIDGVWAAVPATTG